MKNATTRKHRANRSLPALLAVGSSIAAVPAGALELGELTVHSRLGQPLRASIAFALAPQEQLADYCVTLRPGASVSGVPGFGAATVSVSNGVILLSGNTPVREPMVSAHVVVNCPYSANLTREYMLFIDPLTPAYDTPEVAIESMRANTTPATISAPVMRARPQVQARPAVTKDIGTSTRYQVQPGESLSEIAARIENRPVGLWPAVNAIFAANPDAFIDNDLNKLKAGSWLNIPSFDGTAATLTATASEPTVAVATAATPIETAPLEAAPVETAPVEAAAVEAATTAATAVDETTVLRPGDIILDADLEGPVTTSTSPNVATATAVVRTDTAPTESTATSTWLMWLGGSGLALILGLLIFARRFRGDTDTTPVAPLVDHNPGRRASDSPQTDANAIAADDVDFDLSDDSPTEENLALDADLIMGTGLDSGVAEHATEDFGFAETAAVDIELPFEPIAQADDGTDILPPLKTDEHSILDSEILPDDDDYDMSVIVDATKMPHADDVTERDLKAVAVDPDDETLVAQNYTISKEVDYQVLEQDYEDELTATQALNEEIAKAAAELSRRMDEAADNDATSALPLATVTALDVGSDHKARNDSDVDLDDTSSLESVADANDDTVKIPRESGKAS